MKLILINTTFHFKCIGIHCYVKLTTDVNLCYFFAYFVYTNLLLFLDLDFFIDIYNYIFFIFLRF